MYEYVTNSNNYSTHFVVQNGLHTRRLLLQLVKKTAKKMTCSERISLYHASAVESCYRKSKQSSSDCISYPRYKVCIAIPDLAVCTLATSNNIAFEEVVEYITFEDSGVSRDI